LFHALPHNGWGKILLKIGHGWKAGTATMFWFSGIPPTWDGLLTWRGYHHYLIPLPSGKLSHNYEKSPFFIGKSTTNGNFQ
jgi:hypothetical protein